MNLERDIIRALRQVYDPEIPVNVYDLGLIYEIKVNDPTHKLKEGRIILDGERELVSAHPRFSVTHKDGKTVLDVDLSISVGEGYSAKFKA